ncbi:MAG: hypothetical protein RLZ44_1435, partial [Pseudomonadota bacterium]
MRLLLRSRRWLLGGILVLAAGTAGAEVPPLPDPLTLEQALAMADATHPALELAEAERDSSAAELAAAEALGGTRVLLEGRLAAIQPSYRAIDRSSNDSSARLLFRKRLYDFGYTEASTRAAELRLAGSEHAFVAARQQRRLEIMRRFFDVLLADLQYARDNEAMATAFVAVDKARDRNELGQVSDVALLELDAAYQEARRLRFAAEARQRATRAQLAAALNRPRDLPANLVMPPEPDTNRPLPDFEALVTEVLAGNPRLLALQAEVTAAQQALAAAAAADGPVLSGEAEAAVYNRMTNSTNPLGIALVLEVPLATGGVTDAKVAAARAELREAEARLDQARLDLRQSVLDLWLELDALRLRQEELRTLADYRELYLDRSRALYELEVRTDLGDAMVQTSAV